MIKLAQNQITEMNWKDCPQGLQIIRINDNKITEINWKGCPQSLKNIALHDNRIKETNWEGCPRGLQEIILDGNQITEMKLEGCPLYLVADCLSFKNKLDKYKKTTEFLMRFYGKENLEEKLICKNLRNINAELIAKTYLTDDNVVQVFNVKTYKENYYRHIEEIKDLLKEQTCI